MGYKLLLIAVVCEDFEIDQEQQAWMEEQQQEQQEEEEKEPEATY